MLTLLCHWLCHNGYWLLFMPVDCCIVAIDISLFSSWQHCWICGSCHNATYCAMTLSPCLCWLTSTVTATAGWLFIFNFFRYVGDSASILALPPHVQLCWALLWWAAYDVLFLVVDCFLGNPSQVSWCCCCHSLKQKLWPIAPQCCCHQSCIAVLVLAGCYFGQWSYCCLLLGVAVNLAVAVISHTAG